MSKGRLAIFGVFAALAVLIIPFWALSKEGDESSSLGNIAEQDKRGHELFTTNCGRCHTLYSAGSFGTVGPDLDATIAPTTNSPQSYAGNYTRVLNAVLCGIGGRMPAGILTGPQAEEVAKFIAAYAGQRSLGPTVDTSVEEVPEFEGCPEGATGDPAGGDSATEATG